MAAASTHPRIVNKSPISGRSAPVNGSGIRYDERAVADPLGVRCGGPAVGRCGRSSADRTSRTKGPGMQTLPNFIIGGAPKAGTTSLFAYLGQHEQICSSSIKEIEYFRPLRVGHRLPDLSVYAQHFGHCQGERYRMEASPSYAHSGAPVIQGIKATLEQPRILISLREPVARLWSDYTFQRSRGLARRVRDFEDFVGDCERHRAAGTDLAIGNRRNSLSIGFYGEFLPLWLEAFGSDCHVVFAEELFQNPSGVVSDVCQWLEIAPRTAPEFDYAARNRTFHPRSTLLRVAAHRANQALDGVLHRMPALRTRMREVYGRLNPERPPAEKLRTETRERLESVYATSNARTAEALRAHGYSRLPSWLAVPSEQPAAG